MRQSIDESARRWLYQSSEVILFGALMIVYWLTLLQVGARLRLELYDVLLKKALTA